LGHEWIKKRKFPKSYGKLLKSLYDDRGKADYGEYVPTFPEVLGQLRRRVNMFLKRAWKEIPSVSMAHILEILVNENPQIRDFSFDVYCPKTYYHHTRLSIWVPKGRLNDKLLNKILTSSRQQLKNFGVKESKDYVLGLNSRVNQYDEQHILMLDFDDVSTLPYHKLAGEPGFFFRTESGFHFIGSKLYAFSEWEKRMKRYSKIASTQHCELSFKRRYGTLRITESPRKPVKPAYIGRSKPT